MKKIFCLSVFFLNRFLPVQAQELIDNVPDLGGSQGYAAFDIARLGDTMIVGGSFAYLGKPTGHAVPFDPATGKPLTGFPKFNNRVTTIIPDGHGGWYIGGNFTLADSYTRGRIAQVDSVGKLTEFMAGKTFNTQVDAMVKVGDTLFVGGGFTTVADNNPVGRFRELEPRYGFPIGNMPLINTGTVSAAVSDGAGGWYIGGTFTQVGGLTRNRLAHILADGSVGPLDASVTTSGGQVYSLCLVGNRLYVGGAFSTVNGQSRVNMAVVDRNTGVLLPLIYNPNGAVYKMENYDTLLYVAGNFNQFSGTARGRIGSINLKNDSLTSWNPNANNWINGFITKDSTMIVYGTFNIIGGQSRSKIAIIDRLTGSVSAWSPPVIINDIYVAYVGDTTVYIGGTFTNIGGQTRNCMAALGLGSGQLLPFNPNPNSTVNTFLPYSTDTLLIGGVFTSIGGVSVSRLALMDLKTQTLAPWNASPTSTVDILVKDSQGRLFVGGNFTGISATAIRLLAAIHIPTGGVINRSFAEQISGTYIQSLKVVDDSLLYIGGEFTSFLGQSRSRLSSINIPTLTLTSWNPVANAAVYCMDVSANTVYIGGEFTTLNAIGRQRIAAIDKTTGLLTPWMPEANNYVKVLKISGSKIYAGGGFSAIGGQTKNYLAELDLSTGFSTFWGPVISTVSSGAVRGIDVFDTVVVFTGLFSTVDGQARNRGAMMSTGGNLLPFDGGFSDLGDVALYHGGLVYFGGNFKSSGGKNVTNIAAYRISTGDIIDIPLSANGVVRQMKVVQDKLYIGGDFTSINGITKNRLGRVSLPGFSLDPFNPNPNGGVVGLKVRDSLLYVGYNGGNIFGLSNVKRLVACINLSTDSLTEFQLGLTSTPTVLNGIELHDTSLYVYGTFAPLAFNGQNRTGVARVNRFSGLVDSWVANAASVNDLKVIKDSLVIIAGTFTSVNGVARNRLAGLDLAGNLSNWNPGASSTVNNIASGSNQVIFGGNFTTIFGLPRNRAAAMNKNTLLASTWNVNFGLAAVNSLFSFNDTVYAGGSFTTINDQDKRYFAGIRPVLLPVITGLSHDTVIVCNRLFAYGSNFRTTSGVTINGIPSVFAVLNDSVVEIEVPFQATSGPVIVTNPAGSSLSVNLVITSIPAPSAIQGTDTICAGTGNVVFSVSPVSFATGYSWELPLGASITSFPPTNTVTITFGPNAVSGEIRVRGTSSCQVGPFSSGFSVFIKNLPFNPSVPSGIAAICSRDSLIPYSIPAIPNVDAYDWELPVGMYIVEGIGTNNVKVLVGANAVSGNLRARGVNQCGLGNYSPPLALTIIPPPAANITPAGSTSFCVGQDVTLNANTGAGLGHQWSRDGAPIQGAISASYLASQSGQYTVTTFQNGCQNTSAPVTVTANPATQVINLNLTANPSSCNLNTGSASVAVTGGATPYAVNWSSGDTTLGADSLLSGVYTVTVTDATGCAVVGQANVGNIGGPVITLNSIDSVTCFGLSNGTIDLSIAGGLPPYTIQWSQGQTTEDASNLPAGVYQVSVSDTVGCAATSSFAVGQPQPLNVSFNVTPTGCNQSNGGATANVTGGTSPYNYLWNPPGAGNTLNNVPAGIYALSVTDANNCQLLTQVAVGNTAAPEITIDTVIAASCGSNNGSVQISITGGTPPFQYLWSNSATTQDIAGVAAGTYSLTVIGADSCVATLSVVLPNKPLPVTDVCLVTVDSGTRTNEVVWEKPAVKPQGLAYYKVWRESNVAGVFIVIGTVHADSLSAFTDPFANPLIRSFRYYITSVDSCGNESLPGSVHKTVHLVQNFGVGATINLIWDNYQGFPVAQYVIYRNTTSFGWQLIDSLPLSPTFNSYTDAAVPNLADPELFYVVDAVKPGGCTATEVKNFNTTRSNPSRIAVPDIGTGLWVQGLQGTWNVYPVPFGGELVIAAKGICSYELLDLTGRVVMNGKTMLEETILQTGHLPGGPYLLRLVRPEGVTVRKLVKE